MRKLLFAILMVTTLGGCAAQVCIGTSCSSSSYAPNVYTSGPLKQTTRTDSAPPMSADDLRHQQEGCTLTAAEWTTRGFHRHWECTHSYEVANVAQAAPPIRVVQAVTTPNFSVRQEVTTFVPPPPVVQQTVSESCDMSVFHAKNVSARDVSHTGHWHAFAKHYGCWTQAEVAGIIRRNDASVLRVSPEGIMSIVGQQIGRTWSNRQAFASWLSSSEVREVVCTSQLLEGADFGRVDDAGKIDLQFHRDCYSGEKLLVTQVNGREAPFLSEACLNPVVRKP